MSEPTIDDRQQMIADLQAARGELVARGHCVGRRIGQSGSVCTRGAINVAVVDGFEALYQDPRWRQNEFECAPWAVLTHHNARNRAAEQIVARHLPAGFNAIEAWNDERDPNTYAPLRTADDLLNLFDKALAELGGLA
jgi:hypothetical protein